MNDTTILFATRAVRMYGFGAISIVIALYLGERGLSSSLIGWVFTLALAGDALISIGVTQVADRFGRRKLLLVSSALIAIAGIGFAFTGNVTLLILTAIVGTISPNGNEVGPFQALEQASLSEVSSSTGRTRLFGWYQMTGSLATAFGALSAGWLVQTWHAQNANGYRTDKLEAYQIVLVAYAITGVLLAILFSRLGPGIELKKISSEIKIGLNKSRAVVLRLCALFMVDSFGSSLVMQGLTVYWLERRYGVNPATLGGIFFATNLVAAFSNPIAARLADRIGLVNTMVFTHIPANVFLLLFPFAPNLETAIALLIARFCLSQMDVPARTAYVMGVVEPEERSATAGLTQQAKFVGTMLGPVLTGMMFTAGWWSAPFVLGGALKIAYDLALYQGFKALPTRLEDRS
jgi:MFS family permease